MIMNINKLTTIEQLVDFLDGNQAVAYQLRLSKDENYRQVAQLLIRYHYRTQSRKAKGIIKCFLAKVTGYSRAQLTRMISQYVKAGRVERHQRTARGFTPRYLSEDIVRLAKLDERHDTPSGAMIKKLCERAFHVFHETAYARLAGISIAHIYNLRQSRIYQRQRRHFTKTQSKKGATIGVRKKPSPEGKPGFIRINTVHQGDLDGVKGVYHINAVDEVTQFEIVVSVKKISENCLIPALEQLLDAFPFVIDNFHSDNGGEYINYRVAALLEKLRIQLTKSRPRHSNDNALAESKNAAIVRKTLGYLPIPGRFADRLNPFHQQALNPYINYHRPCFFPEVSIDKKGKLKKIYPYQNRMTP